jgi:hypothetical protein
VITKEQLLAEVNDLDDKRQAAVAAASATAAAQQNVTDVTVTEQAQIDAATAHYDQATTTAKAAARDAQSAQNSADEAEQTALNQLIADITAFAAPGAPPAP